MAERTRRALQGHTNRSGTTVHGRTALIFGTPFVAVGVFIVLLSTGRLIEGEPKSSDAPPWVLTACGLVFFGAGLLVVGHGARDVLRRARVRKEAAIHPLDAWALDHDWSREGARDENLRKAFGMLAFAGFMVVFLSPFNWFAFLSGEGPWPVKAFVGFFDLLAALVAWTAAYGFLQVAKYGRTALAFDRFPFFLGETLAVRFRIPPRFRGIDEVRFTLRAVEEAYEVHGTGKNRRQTVVSYEVYRDEAARPLAMAELDEGRDVPVTFPLPADGPTTRLAARPPIYWEIEAKAEAPGIDYAATFLVPVYARASG